MNIILQWLCNGASSDILWLTPVLTQKFRFTQPNELLDPHEIIIRVKIDRHPVWVARLLMSLDIHLLMTEFAQSWFSTFVIYRVKKEYPGPTPKWKHHKPILHIYPYSPTHPLLNFFGGRKNPFGSKYGFIIKFLF